mmetsp:Transcript_65732/g.176120  ORF Transcript_65732/g.176120 Transcript_65732/m.176120 type:complete len:90 (+) Transcript_65732:1069-1338(+)
MIKSALRIVDRRCAMTSVVRPCLAESRASCTTRSDAVSRADVASSSSSIRGLRTSARAIAMRCFWPPLSCAPRSPHRVSYPCGSFDRNS